MVIATPLKLRWERAQQIDPAGNEEPGQGWFILQNSRNPTGYPVQIEFHPDGKLTSSSSTCPDFERRSSRSGARHCAGEDVHVECVAKLAYGEGERQRHS